MPDPIRPSPSTATTRRTVLRAAGLAALTGGGVAVLGGLLARRGGGRPHQLRPGHLGPRIVGPGLQPSAESERAGPQQSAEVPSGPSVATSEVPVGGGVILDDADYVITQPTAGEFKAFSKICTHQRCPVGSVEDGTINCPCHGSKYSIEDGSVVNPPAPDPLDGGRGDRGRRPGCGHRLGLHRLRSRLFATTGGGQVGKAIIFAAVSLDGFIAAADDTVGPLFDWYSNGDVEVTFSDEERVFHTTAQTADFLNATAPKMAAGVLGRRLFDLTNGWHGRPPNGEHAFVVTHQPPTDWAYLDSAPFTFVTEGVRSAIEQAKAFAGDRDVSVTAGQIGGQALR